VTSRRYRSRHLPSSRYRYPYRPRGRGGNEGKIAAAVLGVLLAAASGSRAAHHHAGPRTVPAVTAAAPVAGGSETAFWRALLADLGAPASPADLASLRAWRPLEQPWPPLARWNPLDSILPMPGSWNFNTFGGGLHVQSYPTAAEGAQADALTLGGGNYPLIVSALRSGAGICGDGFASEFGTWSGDGYWKVC
jgi:hypothetical protein